MSVLSSTILDALVAGSLEDAQARQKLVSAGQLREQISALAPALDVARLLRPRTQVHIIAEVKRASPSRGDMAQIADPAKLASQYAAGGASMISVLTEQRKFKGSLDDLRAVRAAVSIPVLRKEFIANEYQLLEARAAGADAALLIVAALSETQLSELFSQAKALGLTPLVEVHTAAEAQRAATLGATLVGVNTRDLKTFTTDKHRFAELKAELPASAIHVAESAVKAVDDVRFYKDHGAHAVLVGEALVTTGSPETRVHEFVNV